MKKWKDVRPGDLIVYGQVMIFILSTMSESDLHVMFKVFKNIRVNSETKTCIENIFRRNDAVVKWNCVSL